MSEVDLNEVIATAVDDQAFDASVPEIPADTSVDASPDTSVEPEVNDASPDPAATPASAQMDEFEKRWGIPAKSVSGRENRIPHSRVKQMVTKAEQDTMARLTKELEGKWTSEKLGPVEAKVKDYEDRLQKVAQFEHVLENDPKTFLDMLSRVPAYKQFFDYVSSLSSQQPSQQPQVPDGMPQPDQALADGTKVYSMEGLQNLLKWQADNVENRVTQRVRQHYAPIEQKWQEEQRMAQMAPVIQRQIDEARQWPHFNELEPDIIKVLNADKQISLEKAYVKVFNELQYPKLVADKNKTRSDVIAELQKKPVSSSAPTGAVRPGQQSSSQPRSLDEVIAQAAKDAGLV